MTDAIAPESDSTPTEEFVPDYSRLGFKDLQKLCKSRGISADGNTIALIDKLRVWDAEHDRAVDLSALDEPDGEEVDLLDMVGDDAPQAPADGEAEAASPSPPSAGQLAVQPGTPEVGATAASGGVGLTTPAPSSYTSAAPAVAVRAAVGMAAPAAQHRRRGEPDLTVHEGPYMLGEPRDADGSPARPNRFRAEFPIGNHELTDDEHFRYIAETHARAAAAGYATKGGNTVGERVGYYPGSAGRVVVYQVTLSRRRG